MKFPNKLSKERLSLLSPEDRKIYEYEHSGLCPEMKQLHESRKKVTRNDEGDIVPDKCPECGSPVGLYIKGEPVYLCSNCGKYFGGMPFHLHETDKYNELTQEDIDSIEFPDDFTKDDKKYAKQILDEILFESMFDELFDKEMKEELGAEEYEKVKSNIFELILNDPDLRTLNEAEGHAMDWWTDCSWIIKLAGGLLTGLLGIIAWLFMKGKDRLAMVKLKQYMNKIVELTDQGVNKKRPWYSFLMVTRKNKQNTGDYNKACFRTIQETAERNMACLYSQAIHNLGFLKPGRTSFNTQLSGILPEEGSGLNMLRNTIVGTDKKKSVYKEKEMSAYKAMDLKLVPFRDDLSYFNNIKLPDIPTNYGMLMSAIDYPTKANENPNGSLFMNPNKEILQAKGSDIGQTYFGGEFDMTKTIKHKSTNESVQNYYNRSLFEVADKDGYDKTKDGASTGVLTPDLDPTAVGGKELEQETQKRKKTAVVNFNGDIVDAIDNYISASVPIVVSLCRAICGKNNEGIKKLAETIHNAQTAAESSFNKYIETKEEVLKVLMGSEYETQKKNLQKSCAITLNVLKLIKAFSNVNVQKMFLRDRSECNMFIAEIYKMINKSNTGNIDEHDLDMKIRRYFINGINTYSDFERELKKNKDLYRIISTTVEESFDIHRYDNTVSLFEGDEHYLDDDKLFEEIQHAQQAAYNSMKSFMKPAIREITIGSDPAEWQIVTNAKDRMTKLKDAADTEIKNKIDLICRTSSTAQSSLGDKFKAALSKHPVRAESLKNIWAKYSDDLQDRIESRIRSIYGGNGNSNIVNTISQFISVTYPNLIATLVYYKIILHNIKVYTTKNPIYIEEENVIADLSSQEDMSIVETSLQFIEYQQSQNNNQN